MCPQRTKQGEKMSNIVPILNRDFYPAFVSDFDTLFNNLFGNSIIDQGSLKTRPTSKQSIPLANVSESKTGYEIDLAAPGMSRDNFEITVENNRLTVSGKNSNKKKDSKYSEFNYSSFIRSWTLPKEVNAEQISANYEAGILSITIPTENKKKHKVSISVD